MNAWEMFIENQSTQNYIIKCLLCHSEIKPSVIKHDRNTIFVCKKKNKKLHYRINCTINNWNITNKL